MEFRTFLENRNEGFADVETLTEEEIMTLLEDFGNLKKFDKQFFNRISNAIKWNNIPVGRNSPIEVVQVKTGTQLKRMFEDKEIFLAQLSFDGQPFALLVYDIAGSRYKRRVEPQIHFAKGASEIAGSVDQYMSLAKLAKLAKQLNGTWIVAKADRNRIELEKIRSDMQAGRIPLPSEGREYKRYIQTVRNTLFDKLKKLKLSKNEIDSMDGDKLLEYFRSNGLRDVISVEGWPYKLDSESIRLFGSLSTDALTIRYIRTWDITDFLKAGKVDTPTGKAIQSLMNIAKNAKDDKIAEEAWNEAYNLFPGRYLLLKYKFDGANIILDKVEFVKKY